MLPTPRMDTTNREEHHGKSVIPVTSSIGMNIHDPFSKAIQPSSSNQLPRFLVSGFLHGVATYSGTRLGCLGQGTAKVGSCQVSLQMLPKGDREGLETTQNSCECRDGSVSWIQHSARCAWPRQMFCTRKHETKFLARFAQIGDVDLRLREQGRY